MPLFRYEAVTETGRKVGGVIDADSFPLAKERLRRQQVMVTRLAPMEEKKQEKGLTLSLQLAFTKDLGQLLKAGLPVYESLLTIEEKYRRHKAHPLFLDLCDRLKNGSSLSAALKEYPKTFDRIYLSMISAAEKSGSLEKIFDDLTQLLTRHQKLKKQLIAAMVYPSFLLAFCFAVVSALLFFIIPSMQELFEGRDLHPLTRFVLNVSSFARNYGSFLLAALTAAAGALFFFLRQPQNRIFLEKFYFRIPFFKDIVLHAALIRLCRTLSILLQGGVPLLEALKLSRQAMKRPLLEMAVEQAEKGISEGRKLSQQLSLSPFIPPLVVRMLAIAEETGNHAQMLQNIAQIYEEEVETQLTQMTTLLQPILLLFLGGVIGLIVLSILLPLTDVSSFIST